MVLERHWPLKRAPGSLHSCLNSSSETSSTCSEGTSRWDQQVKTPNPALQARKMFSTSTAATITTIITIATINVTLFLIVLHHFLLSLPVLLSFRFSSSDSQMLYGFRVLWLHVSGLRCSFVCGLAGLWLPSARICCSLQDSIPHRGLW